MSGQDVGRSGSSTRPIRCASRATRAASWTASSCWAPGCATSAAEEPRPASGGEGQGVGYRRVPSTSSRDPRERPRGVLAFGADPHAALPVLSRPAPGPEPTHRRAAARIRLPAGTARTWRPRGTLRRPEGHGSGAYAAVGVPRSAAFSVGLRPALPSNGARRSNVTPCGVVVLGRQPAGRVVLALGRARLVRSAGTGAPGGPVHQIPARRRGVGAGARPRSAGEHRAHGVLPGRVAGRPLSLV